METTTAPATTTCIVRGCNAEFYLVPARYPVAYLCLDHGDAYMRSSGHQNDPNYSVN